ncbi:hypothetical protein Brsp05_03833 [Brucella sp. NBRC 12953]
MIISRRNNLHPQRIGIGANAADQGMTRMAMRIDETGNDQLARAVDNLFVRMPGCHIRCLADINDPVAVNRQPPILDNASIGIDSHDRPVKQQ